MPGPECTSLLDRAINGSARMADLIDDVLDFARLGGTLKATEVDLELVLGEVLEDLAPRAGRRRRWTSAGCPPSSATAPSWRRAAEPARQRRQVTAARTGRSRSTSVPDTCSAPGGSRSPTTAAACPRRPAPCLRAARPVDDALEGTGIGLATCRRIIGAHGGRIGIDPTVIEGARFWFELPD